MLAKLERQTNVTAQKEAWKCSALFLLHREITHQNQVDRKDDETTMQAVLNI